MSSWFVALLAGPAVLVPLAAYSISHRRVKGARWYGLLLLTIAWWSLAYAWELAAPDAASKSFALKVKYLAVVALPPAWIAFILEFVGASPHRVPEARGAARRRRPDRPGLRWTDPWHGWFWGPMSLRSIGGYLALQGRGPGFFVNIAYTYVVLGAGLVLLLVHTVHSPYLYRTRAVILMVGTILPWAGNVAFVIRREESIFDPTPFLFTCTALVAALAVFRFDLLEPVPTLRDARIGSVGDAVILLDNRRRIADLNVAAEAALGRRRAEAAGHDIGELLPGWPSGDADGDVDGPDARHGRPLPHLRHAVQPRRQPGRAGPRGRRDPARRDGTPRGRSGGARERTALPHRDRTGVRRRVADRLARRHHRRESSGVSAHRPPDCRISLAGPPPSSPRIRQRRAATTRRSAAARPSRGSANTRPPAAARCCWPDGAARSAPT